MKECRTCTLHRKVLCTSAIIMDGNGRWAEPARSASDRRARKGADAVRRTIESAPDLGIGALTLYAFSSDNWKRPAEEVSALMRLFEQYLQTEVDECVRKGRTTLLYRQT